MSPGTEWASAITSLATAPAKYVVMGAGRRPRVVAGRMEGRGDRDRRHRDRAGGRRSQQADRETPTALARSDRGGRHARPASASRPRSPPSSPSRSARCGCWHGDRGRTRRRSIASVTAMVIVLGWGARSRAGRALAERCRADHARVHDMAVGHGPRGGPTRVTALPRRATRASSTALPAGDTSGARRSSCACCWRSRACAAAHPAPFSYLDLSLDAQGAHGSIILHDFDVAHDLGIEPPDRLLDPAFAATQRARLEALAAERLRLTMDGEARAVRWTALDGGRGPLRAATVVRCRRAAGQGRRPGGDVSVRSRCTRRS